MNTILVAIKDKKAEDFGPCYVSKNPAIAVREFTEALPKNEKWKQFPEDFCLCILGEYETESGKIKPLEQIRVLAEAKDFIKGESNG